MGFTPKVAHALSGAAEMNPTAIAAMIATFSRPLRAEAIRLVCEGECCGVFALVDSIISLQSSGSLFRANMRLFEARANRRSYSFLIGETAYFQIGRTT